MNFLLGPLHPIVSMPLSIAIDKMSIMLIILPLHWDGMRMKYHVFAEFFQGFCFGTTPRPQLFTVNSLRANYVVRSVKNKFNELSNGNGWRLS